METSQLSMGITFIAGLLSFLSPCVLPLIPAYIGYMGGRMTHTVALQTTSKPTSQGASVVQRANLFLHGLAFVGGFTFVFVSVGLMTTAFVRVLGGFATTTQEIIGRVGGVVIIFFGLHFMGVLRRAFTAFNNHPQRVGNVVASGIFAALGTFIIVWGFIEPMFILPALAGFWLWLLLGNAFTHPMLFWQTLFSQLNNALYADTRADFKTRQGGGLGSSFLMGVIFSAGWTPCIGPIYGAVLGLAANQGDVSAAVPLLIAYSFGLGVPFLLATLLIDSLQGILRRLRRHMHTIELVSGSLLVMVGVLVASGQLVRLSQTLNNDFADFSYRVEECGVGFFQGHLALTHVGACMGGQLVPVALNQGANGQVSPQAPRMEYVFIVEAAQPVNVEVWNLSEGFSPTATLYDASERVIASSTSLTAAERGRSHLFKDTPLPSAGLYRVVVSDPAEGNAQFRLRVVASSAGASSEEGVERIARSEEAQSVGALSEVANVGSIQAIAQTVPVVGIEKGNIAPDFSLKTLEGEPVALSSLRGNVVILNFWGTWCAPCQREMPELQALYQQYGDVGLRVLGVAVRDTDAKVRDFQREKNITFTLGLDADNAITKQFAITGQPSTLVIGKDGVIVEQFFSVVSQEHLAPIIEAALTATTP
jgi:cytochrome c-type biogenesis protein